MSAEFPPEEARHSKKRSSDQLDCVLDCPQQSNCEADKEPNKPTRALTNMNPATAVTPDDTPTKKQKQDGSSQSTGGIGKIRSRFFNAFPSSWSMSKSPWSMIAAEKRDEKEDIMDTVVPPSSPIPTAKASEWSDSGTEYTNSELDLAQMNTVQVNQGTSEHSVSPPNTPHPAVNDLTGHLLSDDCEDAEWTSSYLTDTEVESIDTVIEGKGKNGVCNFIDASRPIPLVFHATDPNITRMDDIADEDTRWILSFYLSWCEGSTLVFKDVYDLLCQRAQLGKPRPEFDFKRGFEVLTDKNNWNLRNHDGPDVRCMERKGG